MATPHDLVANMLQLHTVLAKLLVSLGWGPRKYLCQLVRKTLKKCFLFSKVERQGGLS